MTECPFAFTDHPSLMHRDHTHTVRFAVPVVILSLYYSTMPNSSDCAPMAQPNATLEVADGTKPPASSGKGSEAEIAYRPPGKSVSSSVVHFFLMSQKGKE